MKQAILLLFVFSLLLNASAQKKIFLRIYDNQGQKIAAGFFAGTNDSALMLSTKDQFRAIAFNEIGTIKTKRTVGHTIAIVTGVTAAVAAMIFVAGSGGDSWLSYTAAEGIVGGLLFGSVTGLVIGSLAGVLKNSHTYNINGFFSEWLKAKLALDKMPVFSYSPKVVNQ